MQRIADSNSRRRLERGLTLIEMLVVAPMIILLIAVIIAAVTSLTGSSLRVHAKNQMVFSVNDALDTIENEVRRGEAFLTTTGTLTSPQGKNDSTTAFTATTTGELDTLIFTRPATTANVFSDSRELIYYNTPNACNTSEVSQNDTFPLTYIYFVKDSVLWQRTVWGPNSNTACGTIGQKPSCSTVGLSSTPAVCKTEDTRLVDNVQDFDVTYYPDATYATTTTPDNAKIIKASISASTNVAGEPVSYTAAITSGSFYLIEQVL